MSVILFYSPFDQRSRDTESLMIAFRQQGHRVISLSQSSGAQIHDYLRQQDIETYAHILPNAGSFGYYFSHTRFLISFIRKHGVQIVYSHLEPANVVASIAQYFVKARVYIVRHHIDVAKLQGFDKSWAYRLTYRLAKKVIVVSPQAKKFMVEVEKINPEKIIHINLAYDFSLYAKPDPEKVKSIKAGFEDHVTLITVGRFTLYKRPEVSIQIVKLLKEKGVKARLIFLGAGEMESKLKTLVRLSKLEEQVLFKGYVANVLDYMAASDFLVHPSVSESSCVTVKEAALVKLPALVCKGVGDFDDYIEAGKNGFALEQAGFAANAAEIIYKNRNADLSPLTASMYKTVVYHFGIENVAGKYKQLNEV